MKLLLKNATVFNGEDNQLYYDRQILIEDNIIVAIAGSEEIFTADRELNLCGKVVMPGLIDAHIHVMLYQQANNSLAYEAIRASVLLKQVLQRGFTTVRDVGGDVWGIARALRDGLVEGPRIVYSGKVLSQTGGHGDMQPARDANPLSVVSGYSNCNQSIIVDSVAAIRKASRENFVKGASFVKIMASGGCASPHDTVFSNQFTAEEIRAACEIADSYQTYVAAHAYMPYSIKRCLENGVRTIEHGNFLDIATAQLMAAKQAFLVPTLITYNLAYEDVLAGENEIFMVSDEVIKSLCDMGLEAIINARNAGVKIGFGTDIVKPAKIYDNSAAFSRQSEEFILRSKIETPFDTIHSATAVNAEILNMKDKIGVVKQGAIADILVVEGNPLADIRLLTEQGKHIKAIIQGGKLVKNEL